MVEKQAVFARGEEPLSGSLCRSSHFPFRSPRPVQGGNHKQEEIQRPREKSGYSPKGRIPRISRLMALAIHMQELIDTGKVSTYAQLATLGHVSRARVSQIMKLNFLAPDIQEKLLFLPMVEPGSEAITERRIRAVAKEPGWETQRGMLARLLCLLC